jgi:hypothetical protein
MVPTVVVVSVFLAVAFYLNVVSINLRHLRDMTKTLVLLCYRIVFELIIDRGPLRLPAVLTQSKLAGEALCLVIAG